MTEQQKSFEGWAVVELFGHAKEVGFVTTETYGQAVLFRVDTPELPEREYTLTEPEYTSNGDGTSRWTPIGAKVKRQASPAKSRLIGPGAVYSIIPCSEATARLAIESMIRRPLILLELPEKKLIPFLPGEPEDRTFACCGANPEEGHEAGCTVGEEEEI